MTIPDREGVSRLRARLDPLDHWKYIDTLSEIVDLARDYGHGATDPLAALTAFGEIRDALDEAGLLDDDTINEGE